jgi:hypothetical protein
LRGSKGALVPPIGKPENLGIEWHQQLRHAHSTRCLRLVRRLHREHPQRFSLFTPARVQPNRLGRYAQSRAARHKPELQGLTLYARNHSSARSAIFQPQSLLRAGRGVRRQRAPRLADWSQLCRLGLFPAEVHSNQGGTQLQFRAEFFNILNHSNLQLPNAVVYSAGLTHGTIANQNAAATFGSPGVISATANTSRQIQLGARILF